MWHANLTFPITLWVLFICMKPSSQALLFLSSLKISFFIFDENGSGGFICLSSLIALLLTLVALFVIHIFPALVLSNIAGSASS